MSRQPAIVAAERYTLEGSTDDLRARLTAAINDAARSRRRFPRLMIGAFLALVAGVMLASLAPYVVLPVAVAVVAVFVVKAYGAYGSSVDERKLGKLIRFLELVGVDTASDDSVHVLIDLRDYRKAGTQRGGDAPSGSTRYEHGWLDVAGRLIDGTRYRFRVVDHIARKERRKRKYTKVRERRVENLDLRLAFRPSRRVLDAALLEALQATEPPAPLRVRRVVVRGQHVAALLRSAPAITTHGRTWGDVSSDETGRALEDSLAKALLWVYEGLRRQSGSTAKTSGSAHA